MIESLVAIAIVGVILHMINSYIPMAVPFKTVINVVAVVLLIVWLYRILTRLGP